MKLRRSDALVKRVPLDEGHRDKGFAIRLVDFEYRTNVGVMQSRRRLRFALEAGPNAGVAEKMSREKLEGDLAFQPQVLGLIDNPHPAFAQFFDDLIMRDGPADQDTSIPSRFR